MTAARSSTPTEVDAVVVGAGFSGLYLLWKLRKHGYTAVALDKGKEVGGTWHWNRYPGARCDVDSHDYSFGFDEGLEQEWEWSERYPSQPELQAYLAHVADRFDLRRDIRLETTVTEAHFDDDTKKWTVRTDAGDTYVAKFCLMAVGCLSVPKDVDVPGLENYTGPIYRTSSWPEEGVDFSGLRVAAIGTGSSGVQAIPEIAKQAGQLTVLQRTANFVIPARNHKLDPAYVADIKANYRERRLLSRSMPAGCIRDDNPKTAFEVSDDERRAEFEKRWEGGGIAFLGAYSDLMVDQKANDAVSDFIRSKIDEIVTDPDTADSLKPYGYPMGAKRPVVGTDWYETFNRDNVELVDLRKKELDGFTEKGMRLADGTDYEFDAIVLATGFDAFTGAFSTMDIRGRQGRSLNEAWSEGPKTHLGLGTAGFPNMFIIANVGSPSVLANMVTAIEQHVEWTVDTMDYMRDQDLETIEATAEAQEAWVETVEEIANMTLWPQGESGSWYRGANIEGKPQIFMPYAGGIVLYEETWNEVREAGFKGFVLQP
ncbi:flavin-containing monooxygenase [Rhodococcus chondri]|uniref:NAD(P)/FAD-dependent oxidoreductase n=1 Tax=Rhodococcus chondri TaxID=3065941 RepID=A0ABU7JTH1_9NOCA|nr:NAD(P)/FAD-dependent oxidoreductase [Rhodococcus sp. CC-R104]MEE2033323.1 NAD(P)/FAD-dependent oxidoreductase [Rhodococcus sp. CC-R104]